ALPSAISPRSQPAWMSLRSSTAVLTPMSAWIMARSRSRSSSLESCLPVRMVRSVWADPSRVLPSAAASLVNADLNRAMGGVYRDLRAMQSERRVNHGEAHGANQDEGSKVDQT